MFFYLENKCLVSYIQARIFTQNYLLIKLLLEVLNAADNRCLLLICMLAKNYDKISHKFKATKLRYFKVNCIYIVNVIYIF